MTYVSLLHQISRCMTFMHPYSVARAAGPSYYQKLAQLTARSAGNCQLVLMVAGVMTQTASSNSWPCSDVA